MAVNSIGAAAAAYETKAQKTVKKEESAKLSKEAKSYLKDLEARHGNMDFTIASYSTKEEAQEYLSKGNKEFSVLIDPETLEKMAADPAERKKYEKILEDAKPQFEKAAKELGEDANTVKSWGVAIDNNGNASYFATLLDSAKIEKPKKTEETSNKTDHKEQTVKAGSISELIEKIREARKEEQSSLVRAEKETYVGQSFDAKW